tara:strand:+ start:75 stop:368 length:294 start_codon:yes stop_codon:yes gene_type:complete
MNQNIDTYFIDTFLDYNNNIESIPQINSGLYNEIKLEHKRRILVDLRYKSNKNKKCRNYIYKIINKNSNYNLKPQDLYAALDKLSYNQLLQALQHCK